MNVGGVVCFLPVQVLWRKKTRSESPQCQRRILNGNGDFVKASSTKSNRHVEMIWPHHQNRTKNNP